MSKFMKPISRVVLIKRGKCCGSGCTNCPYIPSHKEGATTIFTPPEDIECFPIHCSLEIMQSGRCMCSLEYHKL